MHFVGITVKESIVYQHLKATLHVGNNHHLNKRIRRYSVESIKAVKASLVLKLLTCLAWITLVSSCRGLG